jgi:hypothetical protein
MYHGLKTALAGSSRYRYAQVDMATAIDAPDRFKPCVKRWVEKRVAQRAARK